MLIIASSSSPCVCRRDFEWSRLLSPNTDKGDTGNWLVCFGPNAGDEQWRKWCYHLQSGIFPFDRCKVLLVTTEAIEIQCKQPLYLSFDCRDVRTLSDPHGVVGRSFGVEMVNGEYPFASCFVFDGKIVADVMISFRQ